MRELIGSLVAVTGVEVAAARMADGTRQFHCTEEPADGVHALIDGLLGVGMATEISDTAIGDTFREMLGDMLGDLGRMMVAGPSIAHVGEYGADNAVEEIAGAIPGFGQFVSGSQARQPAGKGARRI